MLSLAGRTGFDPVARRRLRRASARARPWLLPVAVLLAALLVGGRQAAPAPVHTTGPLAATVPVGRVLVVVSPSDPAVLHLASPGTQVDVYGATTSFDGLDGPAEARAVLLAAAAVVVGTDGDAGTGGIGAGPPGPLEPGAALSGSPAPGAVTLAVTDDEAAALAAQQGAGLTLAVRAGPARGG